MNIAQWAETSSEGPWLPSLSPKKGLSWHSWTRIVLWWWAKLIKIRVVVRQWCNKTYVDSIGTGGNSCYQLTHLLSTDLTFSLSSSDAFFFFFLHFSLWINLTYSMKKWLSCWSCSLIPAISKCIQIILAVHGRLLPESYGYLNALLFGSFI